ncbi:MAG: hypothetical protein Kow00120_31100 [Anaerolineae bacterium]
MTTIDTYTQFGGQHPETAALTNTLAALGLKAPHTDAPLTEAMLLGVGGGLGAGYILWEFKEHNNAVLVLGFRNNWQYPVKFYENLCNRLGVRVAFQETGGKKTAERNLLAALDRGIPAVAWVDRAHMPYLQLPDELMGWMSHIVSIHAIEDGHALVDDLATQPFSVPLEDLADARARIGSNKNRLLLVETLPDALDLPATVRAGLADCAAHLSQKSDSFSLPTFRKWARLMTDTTNKKGWPVVFADRTSLYGALKSVYEGVKLGGANGGGLRGLYADFLDEAAAVLGAPPLQEVAAKYRMLAALWDDFAEASLPDDVEPLRQTKALLQQRNDLLMAKGDGARDATTPLVAELAALHTECSRAFPMNDAAVEALFAALQERMAAIYAAEVAALDALKAAT